MSSFCRLFTASRISPSEEMNSVYIMSAPPSLQTARKGGSLTSSIGARSNGNSPNSILPIFAIFGAKLKHFRRIMENNQDGYVLDSKGQLYRRPEHHPVVALRLFCWLSH